MYMFSVSHPFTAGQMVYTVRQRCGRQLAIEAPTDADVVSTVPESATPAALGYAEQVCPIRVLERDSLTQLLVDAYPHKLCPSRPPLTVRPAIRRGSVQEPLRRKDVHSAKYPPEAAGGCQEVWGFDGQLCRKTSGVN